MPTDEQKKGVTLTTVRRKHVSPSFFYTYHNMVNHLKSIMTYFLKIVLKINAKVAPELKGSGTQSTNAHSTYQREIKHIHATQVKHFITIIPLILFLY